MNTISIEEIRGDQKARKHEERLRACAEDFSAMARERLPIVLQAAISSRDPHRAFTITKQIADLLNMYMTLLHVN